MRLSNNRKISKQDTERQVGQASYASFVKHSNSVLTLPRFSEKIKTEFSTGVYSKNLAGLALNLLDLGYIKEKTSGDLKTLVKKGIQQWVNKNTKEIEMFSIQVEVRPEINHYESLMYDSFDETTVEMGKIGGESPMYFLIDPNQIPIFYIGRVLTELENKVPGLGKTVYYWIATVGTSVFNVYTPWQGDGLAPHAWWYGEDNQEDFIEAVKEYNGDDEDFDESNYVSPNDWKNAFPAWVTAVNQELDEAKLNEIAGGDPEALEAKVAQAVLAIIKLKEASIPGMSLSITPVYNSLYLHWAEGDMSRRLVDDYLNECSQVGEGYTETLTLCVIPYQTEQLKVWMDEISNGFEQLKNIERLIKLIGDPE